MEKISIKATIQTQKQYIDYLIGQSFQGEKRFFVLSLQSNPHWTLHTRYFIPTREIKHYNVMIDRGNFFDQLATG